MKKITVKIIKKSSKFVSRIAKEKSKIEESREISTTETRDTV